MLWTEQYRPADLAGLIGQDRVVGHLSSFAKTGSVPHLLLTGRHGTGKTTAIEAFSRALYAGNWPENTSVFQTADLFSSGKSYLEEDERYAHLFQKGESLLTNFKHIIREYAAIRPLDAPFKLMVFEDAHAMPREAQQALRRIMERTSGTCRFILSTTNQSAILPAISSRCLPLFFAPIGSDLMLRHLETIRAAESRKEGMHPCDPDQMELIVQASDGDMRRALLLLQLVMTSGRGGDLLAATRSEPVTVASSAFAAVRNGDLRTAVRQIESLMIDFGLPGREVLTEIRPVIRRDYNHPGLALALAAADVRLLHANNEFVHLGSLVHDMYDVIA